MFVRRPVSIRDLLACTPASKSTYLAVGGRIVGSSTLTSTQQPHVRRTITRINVKGSPHRMMMGPRFLNIIFCKKMEDLHRSVFHLSIFSILSMLRCDMPPFCVISVLASSYQQKFIFFCWRVSRKIRHAK